MRETFCTQLSCTYFLIQNNVQWVSLPLRKKNQLLLGCSFKSYFNQTFLSLSSISVILRLHTVFLCIFLNLKFYRAWSLTSILKIYVRVYVHLIKKLNMDVWISEYDRIRFFRVSFYCHNQVIPVFIFSTMQLNSVYASTPLLHTVSALRTH